MDLEGWVAEGVARRMETIRRMDAEYDEIQRAKLLSIVARNAETEFGRRHDFASIDSVRAFRANVAPGMARDYRAEWRRVATGANGVLCADPVCAFSLSSGTTGEPKLVPYTQALLRGLKRAIGNTVASWMARTGRYNLLRGYALQLTGQPRLEDCDGRPVGHMTGLLGVFRTYPFHQIGIPTRDVLNLPDWNEKYRLIVERHGSADVRMVFGVPSYVESCFLRLAAARGTRDVRAAWPELGVVVTSGFPLVTYRARLDALCPGATFLEMYLATEAPVAFQPDPDDPGMQLMVEDAFFEFVPLDRWGEPDPPRFALGEVETGVPYVLLVTTPAGLYAYAPGDVVRFSSLDPPRLLLSGRIDTVVEMGGVRLDEVAALDALAAARVLFREFSVCAGAEGHEWIVETDAEIDAEDVARLEEALCARVAGYRAARAQGRLGGPVVRRVAPGTFARSLERRPGQGKILRVYKDRKVQDELLALAGRPVHAA